MQKSKIATTNSAHHLYPANKGAKGSASPANLSPRKSGRDTAVALAKKEPKEEFLSNEVFKKVDLTDSKLDPEIRSICERFGVGSSKYSNAVIQERNGSLIINCEGKPVASELFGGESALSRGLYKVFGIGRFLWGYDRSIGAKAYQKLFLETQGPEGVRGESLGHLVDGLKTNHYHACLVFPKNKDGKYSHNDVHVGILDSYELLMRPFLEKHLKIDPELLEKARKQYEGKFSLDKLIVDESLMKENPDMISIYHVMAQALQEAQGYELMTLPAALHVDPIVDSDTNNLMSLSLFVPAQMADGEWKVFGRKEWLKSEWFDGDAQKQKAFEERIIEASTGSTFARPIKYAQEAVDPSLGWAIVSSQTYAGSECRIDTPEELEMMDRIAKINSTMIQAFNSEHQLKSTKQDHLLSILQQDLAQGEHVTQNAEEIDESVAKESESQDAPKSEGKNGSWWSRLFGGAKKEEKPTEPTPEAESTASEEASTEEAEEQAESDGEAVDEDDSVEFAEEEHSSSTARSAKPSKPGVA